MPSVKVGVGGVVLLCGGIVNKNEARSLGGEREVGSGSLSLYLSFRSIRRRWNCLLHS